VSGLRLGARFPMAISGRLRNREVREQPIPLCSHSSAGCIRAGGRKGGMLREWLKAGKAPKGLWTEC